MGVTVGHCERGGDSGEGGRSAMYQTCWCWCCVIALELPPGSLYQQITNPLRTASSFWEQTTWN